MADAPTTTSTISTPVKAGATGVAAGGVTVIGYQFRNDRQVLLILVLGVVCVILLLLAYRWFLVRRERARAQMMGEDLKAGSRRKPREINSPQALAKIADLQTKFEEGVEKFRAAGKNLYSLPWYLLVGEPGSGKTEAIRHCNVGFPPGLQEEQQGVGGTVNMNWWFTNYAVILDTAGRLIFDGVEAGNTAEWREFLKLLHKARPDCPVNGLLLVIPADSLIVDSADKIDAKAGKIAQQLDTIRRGLGVRFPVFVVVTKSDRINGFREFFDSMDDPRLQHQILGWSNSDPLDTPFNPDAVDQHLADVAQRLQRRRLGLLLDPVHSEDPNGRRMDQVDALYAFPESLTTLAPRLRRYLERIFSVGEWSPKPLFLRGIYFTSSMREGSALDKELADLLGVAVESLPEGRVWEQDRSYFLRDLFMNKVFREKGLVTRAGNTRGVTTRRKVAVLGSGIAAVVVLTALTVVGSRTLDRNVASQARYWEALNDTLKTTPPPGTANTLAILGQVNGAGPAAYAYRGADDVDFGPGKQSILQVILQSRAESDAAIQVPAAYSWTKLAPAFEKRERHDATQVLFESSVVVPLVDSVREKMRTSVPLAGADSAGAAHLTAAIEELLHLEAQRAGAANAPRLNLEPLFRYLLDDEQYGKYRQDQASLQGMYDWLFPQPAWSFQVVEAGNVGTADAVNQGIGRLVDYWKLQFGDDDHAQRVTVRLLQQLRSFRETDDELAHEFSSSGSLDSVKRLAFWKDHLAKINAETAKADGCLQQIDDAQPSPWSDRTSLVALYQDDRTAAAQNVNRQLQAVRSAFPQDATGTLHDAFDRLSAEHAQLARSTEGSTTNPALQNELIELDGKYFHPTTPGSPLRYQLIDHAYLRANDVVQRLIDTGLPEGDALTKLESAAGQISQARQDGANAGAELPPDATQRATCQSVVNELGVATRISSVMNDAVQFASAADLSDMLQTAATPNPVQAPLRLPMTAPVKSDQIQAYNPATVGRLLKSWAILRSAAAAPMSDQYALRDQAVSQFDADYVHYWEAFLAPADRVQAVAWKDLATSLPEDDAARQWSATATAVKDALSVVDLTSVPQPLAAEIRKNLAEAAASIAVPVDARAAMRSLDQRWKTLAAMSASQARANLVNQGPDAVAHDDLILKNVGSPYEAYWRAVAQAAFLSLKNEPGSVADDRRRQLINFDRFPLAPPADGVRPLTQDELAQVSSLLQNLKQFQPRDPNEFADVMGPDLAAAYRKIKYGNGDADASGPIDTTTLQQMQRLTEFLNNGDTHCTISTVNQATQEHAARLANLKLLPPTTTITFFEKSDNGKNQLSSSMPAFAADMPSGDATKVNYTLQTGGSAEVDFGDGDQCIFPAPYQCLWALYKGRTPMTDDKTKWLVPVHPSKSADVIFVLFTLDKSLPDLPQ